MSLSRRTVTCLLLAAVTTIFPACSSSGPPAAGKHYGKYVLQDTKYDNVDRNKAQANAADMLTQLQSEPHVCLIGLWAYNPPAILEAVNGQSKKDVKINGFDEDERTLQGIKDGKVHGTVVQQPFMFGYQAVKLMAALAKDPKAPLPKEAVNGVWNVPHLVIKKDNVDDFKTKLAEQKKLGAAPAPEAGDAPKVGFVTNNTEEFWTIAEAGTRKAAEEFKVNVLFRRPKTGSAADQKEMIDDLLSQGVKAIAISVIDPANQSDYLNKIAATIPLITQDNDAPATKRLCYIGTDNYAAGKSVGTMVKEVLPDGGTIGIFVGQPDPLNAKQRRQGVLDELAGKKDAAGD